MSRSLRKGPYIQEALEKRILAMNAVSYTHLTLPTNRVV